MKEYVLVKGMSTKCHLKLLTIKFAKMLDLKKKKDISFSLIHVFSISARSAEVRSGAM